MAEAISNFISKRRNRSSGSEDEANEPKKLRNTVHENESQIDEVEEDQNVIVKAPEMTDDVSSKLEVILVKLNNTEVSVKNVETNLASLEKRMTKLEEAELSTKCDIKAINKRIDTLDEKLTNSPTIPVYQYIPVYNYTISNGQIQQPITTTQEETGRASCTSRTAKNERLVLGGILASRDHQVHQHSRRR